MPTRREWIWLLALLALCAVSWLVLGAGQGQVAEVSVDGAVVARLPLSKDTRLSLSGNEILVEDGTVRVITATCLDGLCMRQGAVKAPGQSIVCLPHRVVVTVLGDDPTGVDAVSN